MSHHSSVLLLAGLAVGCSAMATTSTPVTPLSHEATARVRCGVVDVDGLRMFYREAGDPRNPTIVLLHGYPSSSHMFRKLMPLLADQFHLIAPDYPGFGYSDAPADFEPTFDHVAQVTADFLVAMKSEHAVYYLQDFGGPVGFRIASKHPEWVQALIIQNANAYEEGLAPNIAEGNKKRFEKPATVDELGFELGPQLAQLLYQHGARSPDSMDPDAWSHCEWAMRQPGHARISAGLLNNYQSNVLLYPEWHAYLAGHQPRTLIVWGKGDPVFLVSGAQAYKKDLKNVETHILDTSHFALEEDSEVIAKYIRSWSQAAR